MLLIDGDKVIKIAGDSGHGQIAGGNIETFKTGERVRKDRQLYLPRHLKLRVDVVQLFHQLCAGFSKENVAAHASFDDCWREGLVNIVDGADVKTLSLVFRA